MDFKFNIGDIVTTAPLIRDAELGKRISPEKVHRPAMLVILSRSLEECYGGIQRHYLCRTYVERGLRERIQFNEIELIPYPE